MNFDEGTSSVGMRREGDQQLLHHKKEGHPTHEHDYRHEETSSFEEMVFKVSPDLWPTIGNKGKK